MILPFKHKWRCGVLLPLVILKERKENNEGIDIDGFQFCSLMTA